MKKKYILFLCIIITLSILSLMTACSKDSDPVSPDTSTKTDTLSVGVIIPMTGSGPLLKDPEIAAIDLALQDVNQYLAEQGTGKYIHAEIRDSKFSALDIQDALEFFNENNIKIIVFSGTSANLQSVENYVNNNNMLLINQTSTSAELSQEDNIFRLVPDDNYLANAMAQSMVQQSVNKSVVLYRGDVWGCGLAESFESAFIALGGSILEKIGYDPRYTTTELEDALNRSNTLVENAISSGDADNVAMTCLCFEEGIELLKLSADKSSLDKMSWYSSDGMAQNQALLVDSTAASFAAKVGFFSPIMAENYTTAGQTISNRIEEQIGYTPYSWAVVLYDAFWTAALTRIDDNYSYDINDIKSVFLSVLENYDAVSGDIILNDNGDRASSPYDFWQVIGSNDAYQWTKAFTFQGE